MCRHMYVRFVLAVMLVAVGFISLNPFFLLLGGVFAYSAFHIWQQEKDEKDREGRQG